MTATDGQENVRTVKFIRLGSFEMSLSSTILECLILKIHFSSL